MKINREPSDKYLTIIANDKGKIYTPLLRRIYTSLDFSGENVEWFEGEDGSWLLVNDHLKN